jgi:hypothetical protein
MTAREKKLALMLGSVLVFLGVWLGWRKVSGIFEEREARLSSKLAELSRRDMLEIELHENVERMDAWRERSLPSDERQAGTLYQNWLLQLIDSPDVRLHNAQVEAARPSRMEENLRLPFTVSGRGTLAQVTAFLHGFYRSGQLHKITRLTITPQEDSGLLEMRAVVEAIMMPEATTNGQPRLSELAAAPAEPLRYGDLAKYQEVINGRHIFSTNEPPQFVSASPPPAPRAKPYRYQLQAKDTDGSSSGLKFELIEGPAGASVSSSGTVTWNVPADAELTTHEFTVRVTDAGIPPRAAEQRFSVEVVNAPPELANTSHRVMPKQTLRVPLDVRDPDGDHEKLQIELVSPPEGVTLDGGRTLQWTVPDEPGRDYQLAIKLTDELGHTATHTLRVQVERPAERPAGFPHERHAILTAVIQRGDKVEAWVNVRTLGQMVKLFEGDQARIGELEFIVRGIDQERQRLELEADGRSRYIQLGEPLSSPVDEGI